MSLLLFYWQITWDKNWTIWCGYVWRENSCPYFYGNNYLDNVFFLTTKNRPYFQLNVDTYYVIIHIYILQLLIWILFLFRWQPWLTSTITSVIKRQAFVCFITFKSIYLKSIHSGPKSKVTISHDWCDGIGLKFFSFCMCRFSTYFEERGVLESTIIVSS